MQNDRETSSSGNPGFLSGPRGFLFVLGFLFALRISVGLIRVPIAVADGLSLLFSAVFLALPILGLFFAANYRWTVKLAGIFIGSGVLVHALFAVLENALKATGITALFLEAIAQTGLVTWCAGLGAMLAMLIKDKNLLLPVAIFLAGLDVFLVTYPVSTTRTMLNQAPQVFNNVAYAMPKATSTAESVGVNLYARIGPADFFFLFMFFVCLFKFQLKEKATLIATSVALIVYLLVVLLLGDYSLGPVQLNQLPALLPIGAMFLIVNASAFKLNKEEIAGTVIFSIIAVGLAFAGIRAAQLKKEQTPVPLQPPAVPAPPR